MDANVPNLDCMDLPELAAFRETHDGGRRYGRLFGSEVQADRAGKVRAARLLAKYARWKYLAVDARLRGLVQSALSYETDADKAYNELPEWARW